jgi:hypothetical protein
MAEADPTLRYIQRGGASVLEVGGTWTVFSMKGLRSKVDKARRATRGGSVAAAALVDAKHVEQILKLSEELEDHDDVQSVSANFNISDELMAKVQ